METTSRKVWLKRLHWWRSYSSRSAPSAAKGLPSLQTPAAQRLQSPLGRNLHHHPSLPERPLLAAPVAALSKVLGKITQVDSIQRSPACT